MFKIIKDFDKIKILHKINDRFFPSNKQEFAEIIMCVKNHTFLMFKPVDMDLEVSLYRLKEDKNTPLPIKSFKGMIEKIFNSGYKRLIANAEHALSERLLRLLNFTQVENSNKFILSRN